MPELPEVQTTVNGLNKTVKGLTIKSVWTDLAKSTVARPDYRESIKYLPFFKDLEKKVTGAKIVSAERRAKNILINLSHSTSSGQANFTILVHLKMTGHLLYGKYQKTKNNIFIPAPTEKNKYLSESINGHIHFALTFTNGKSLVLSDVRKFAKVTLLATKEAHLTKHLSSLGPEIFDSNFNKKKFEERLTKKPNGKIKSVLMDQNIISGVGNIYSDEALWLSGIHPESTVKKIGREDIYALFFATKKVLEKGIKFGGDSMSDYRRIDGSPGDFSHEHNAYRRKGLPCKKKNCKGVIIRSVVGGRSAHFCNKHQKRFG